LSRTVIQSYQTGVVEQVDLPRPALRPHGVVAETRCSVISPGTEQALTELARKSLLGKALARPDLVQQVLDKARVEGVLQTLDVSLQRLDTPIPLGYSVVATVLEAGQHADVRVGQRIAGTGAGYANHAELNYIPRTLCVPVPDAVEDEHAAFAGLGAIALHAVRTCEVTIGETVVVLGAGLLGLLAQQMLRASGARVIALDLDAQRLRLARELGAEHAFASDDPATASCLRDVTHGRGADAVLIFAAAPGSSGPLAQAAEIVAERGRVVAPGLVRLDVPRKAFYEKEVVLHVPRAAGPGMYDESFESGESPYPISQVRWSATRNLEAFLAMVADGSLRLDPLITHRIDFDEILPLYQTLASGEDASSTLGVVVRYAGAAGERSTKKRVVTAPIEGVQDRRPGIGIIGSGLFTRTTLLPVLNKVGGFLPRGIASRGGLYAFVSARKFHFSYATSDYRELLEDSAIDAVLVTTQHDQHAKLAVEALRAGKHVLVEKPLALSRQQLLEVLSVAEECPGQLLMVGFNRRFAPTVQFLQEKLRSLPDPLAILIRVNAGYVPPSSWVHSSRGGGRIHSEVCHYLDLVQALSGSVPVRVHAESLRASGYRASDNVAIHLTLADGGIASILYTGAGDKGYSRERVEVHGSGCSAEIDGFRSARFVAAGRSKSKRLLRPDYGHAGELRAFLEATAEGGAPPVGLQEYAATTWATLAVEESLGTGRAVGLEEVKAGSGRHEPASE
jgi:predicted dehydrogenase/threonine dehydrogenase-like Zn-dependent dehydrogenase